MMKQYVGLRSDPRLDGHILFFQMGEFYELFFSDAKVAAPVLGIALTQRGKHLGTPIPMCGMPIHAADRHIAKLLQAGHKVAICEQI